MVIFFIYSLNKKQSYILRILSVHITLFNKFLMTFPSLLRIPFIRYQIVIFMSDLAHAKETVYLVCVIVWRNWKKFVVII